MITPAAGPAPPTAAPWPGRLEQVANHEHILPADYQRDGQRRDGLPAYARPLIGGRCRLRQLARHLPQASRLVAGSTFHGRPPRNLAGVLRPGVFYARSRRTQWLRAFRAR